MCKKESQTKTPPQDESTEKRKITGKNKKQNTSKPAFLLGWGEAGWGNNVRLHLITYVCNATVGSLALAHGHHVTLL